MRPGLLVAVQGAVIGLVLKNTIEAEKLDTSLVQVPDRQDAGYENDSFIALKRLVATAVAPALVSAVTVPPDDRGSAWPAAVHPQTSGIAAAARKTHRLA